MAEDQQDGVEVVVYGDLAEAEPFLLELAGREEPPWTFDIEAFDAAQFPSRRSVSTNPCHPDFRVRGVAVALSSTLGYWLDFPRGGPRDAPHLPLAALGRAFGSAAEKWAFNGGFDENGLVYPGWVPSVRNRAGDAMLDMIALGDGTHTSLTLVHGVAAILGKDEHWKLGEADDKSMMREMPTARVARAAVRDACRTHELHEVLDRWAAEGRHVEWSRLYAGRVAVVDPGSDDDQQGVEE